MTEVSFLPDEEDDLLPEATRLIVLNGKSSAMLLPRQLRIGYGRARLLLDAMQRAGFLNAVGEVMDRDPDGC